MAPKHPRPKVAESGPKRKETEQSAPAPSGGTRTYARRAPPSAAARGKAPMTEPAPPVPTGHNSRFLSKEHENWFNKNVQDRHLFKERVLLSAENDDDGLTFIHQRLENRGWSTLFYLHGKNKSCPSIVKEFYANAKPLPDNNGIGKYKSWVRGCEINYSPFVINSRLGSHLPPGVHCTVKLIRTGKVSCDDLEILKTLCVEGAQWETDKDGKPFRLHATDLIPCQKLWFHLIQNFLMPSLNTSQVQRRRALLIYALRIDGYIDLGEIVASQIESAATDRRAILVFPALITQLCRDQGVNLDGEQWVEPEPPISLSQLRKKVKKTAKKRTDAGPSTITLRSISTQLHQVQQDVQGLKIGQKEIQKDVKHIRGDFKMIKSMMRRLLASKYKESTAGNAEEEASGAADADDSDDDRDDEQHSSDQEGGSGDDMEEDDAEEEDDDADFDPADE